MTLAVILTVVSLLGGTTGSATPPLLLTGLQEQQSGDSKPPAQAPQNQDQSPQDSPAQQQPTQEASPAPEPEQKTGAESGNAKAQESRPSVEKPAEQPSSDEKGGKARPSARKTKHKKAPPKTSSGPKKIVVRDGGTGEPNTQLTPGMPYDQATLSRQTTSWLLSSTEANLKRASARALSSNQQATVQQIKMFMDQASAAMKDGEFQRGHNLAMKAHLLSDDLLKH